MGFKSDFWNETVSLYIDSGSPVNTIPPIAFINHFETLDFLHGLSKYTWLFLTV